MNSPKDEVAVVTDAMYVILGGSGNTGSIISNSLLARGQKVRVVGRDLGRLQRLVHLNRGDMVVQNGTRHAWRNKGTKPVTILFFLNGARASETSQA